MAGEPGHSCARGPRCASDYQGRVSGPLMDRIDIRIDVPAVSASELMVPAPGEASAAIARRVLAARRRQRERYLEAGHPEIAINARAPASLIETIAVLDPGATQLFRDAAEKMRFSARAYHRILKVALTLADLESSARIGRIHIAEAIAYRLPGDRMAAVA